MLFRLRPWTRPHCRPCAHSVASLFLLSLLPSLGACVDSPVAPFPATPVAADDVALIDARTLVLGQDPGAVAQVTQDLTAFGFTMVERDRMAQLLDNFNVRDQQPGWEIRLVHTGFESGAELVVLVDVDGGLASPSVRVKAIEVESGAVLWSGAGARTVPVTEGEYPLTIKTLSHEAVMAGLMMPDRGSDIAVER